MVCRMNKNYANLIRLIFGEKSVCLDEKTINENKELSQKTEELLAECWSPFDMHYIAVNDFILEGKTKEDFAEYIKENADELAKHYTAKALRRLRHPKNSGQLKPYIKLREE